jgi:hypothetical protein
VSPRGLLVIGVPLVLTACATSAAVTVSPAPPTTAPAAATTTTSTAPATTTTAAPPAAVDVCALLTDADLSPVFPTGAPPSRPNDYGQGFGDCTWDDGKGQVLVTIMPRANLQSDYVGQLRVGGPAPAPGLDGGVWFPGVVGLGQASSGGRSVGFAKGERGAIVAVRPSVADDQAALVYATALAMAVASRL